MSIFSMTGFGESTATADLLKVVVEIKSVNHRFVDISCRLPSVYQKFENELVKLAQQKVRRGRLEVFVVRKKLEQQAQSIYFNEELFKTYAAHVSSALSAVGCGAAAIEQAVAQGLNRRELLDFVAGEEAAADEYPVLEQAFSQALDQLVQARQREGLGLQREVLALLSSVESGVETIRGRAEVAPEAVKARLLAKIQKISPEVQTDPVRFAQEVAYVAERVDVTEELTRLGSHCALFRQTLSANEGGRKLEFVLQELGREINTIGSKTQDVSVSGIVVEIKSLLEKIREQTANIE